MIAAEGNGHMKISKTAGARKPRSISPAVQSTGKQRKRTVKTGGGTRGGASGQRRLQRGRKRRFKGQGSSYNRAFDQAYNQGYNLGFAKGFEDGHQLAYEQQP